MLQAIRDRATGWIAWAIVILITIPFALWGIYDYLGPTQTIAVATVNGNDLELRQFQQRYQQERRQIRTLLGAAYRADMIDEGQLRNYTLNQLVEDEVTVQTGLADGMRIGDDQLAVAIRTLADFQLDGQFSQGAYDVFLRNRGYSPLGFEYDMRRTLLIEQVSTAVRFSAVPSRHEHEALARLREQTRTYRTFRLDPQLHRPLDVSDADIASYYESHHDLFVSPRRVRIEYIEISLDALARTIEVDDAELRSLYDNRKANYVEPDQREASHILIILDQDADDATVNAARDRLAAIRSRIDAGESFEELARELSEDPGSAPQGGSLGWFGRGIMDPAFEEAAFALSPGYLSDVVQSSFGLHLLEVTGARDGEIRSFDKIRPELLLDYQGEQAEQLFVERANVLQNLSFEQPDTLTAAADELGQEIVETGFISRDGDGALGIAAEPRFLAAAFSTEVLEQRNNSELLEFNDGRVVVLRVSEDQPANLQRLDVVRDRVADLLAADAGAKAARETGVDLVQRLRAGESMQSLSEQLALEWSEPRTTAREPIEDDSALVTILFRMPRPDDGSTVYDGLSLDGGDFVVIALETVGTSSRDDAQGASKNDRLAAQLGAAELAALVSAFRLDAQVEVHQQNLQ